MTVKIAAQLTRTSDGVDYRTGKMIRKIFHPNGKVEIWELNQVGEQTKQIQ